MNFSDDTRLQKITSSTLTPIVLRALGQDNGSLITWTAELIQSHPGGGGLGPSLNYRFSGTAHVEDALKSWSLILKVITQAIAIKDHDPLKADDWQRQVAFYESDLRHKFPTGFRSVDCYAISEQKNKRDQLEYWLWLENLSSHQMDTWELQHYNQLSYALGRFNGTFLLKQTLPSEAWFYKDNIRHYLSMAEPMYRQLFKKRNAPLVRRAFPTYLVDNYVELWDSHEQHLSILDSLPQTLCHGDAQQSNLFLITESASKAEVVAIDWDNVGLASLGLDVAQLLMFGILRPNLFSKGVDMDQILELDQRIFSGYLDGIQSIGWQGDPDLVRLGYRAAMVRVITTLVFRTIGLFVENPPGDPKERRYFEEHTINVQGIEREDLADNVCQLSHYFYSLLEESFELRDQLL